MKEVIKVFDLFIENAETKEVKELIKDIKEMYEENEKLHSIINKVREYCDNNKEFTQRLEDILEIIEIGERK